MNEKLYVGNLSYSTTESDLRTLFSQAGTVSSCELIKDRDSGQSKGFAFVTMGSQAEAEKATSMFNGKPLDNRNLTVNTAKPREERRPGGGNDRGGQHRNVIDAAKKAGVKRIVYTSILKGFESGMWLALDHQATEKALAASGIAHTILRNGWYTENYTGALKAAVEHGAVIGACRARPRTARRIAPTTPRC